MAKRKKKKDHIHDETIDKAVKTGFLFDLSINFYENHTHDELIEKGYREVQVECANRVLAHFKTSVGAKLGRCPEKLWSMGPCVDCGKDVDRKFNTFPIYGSFLCKACKLARDAPRRCIDCRDKYHDQSLNRFVADPLVRRNVHFHEMPYLCSWCALLKGDVTFIRERTPPQDRDEKMLATEMGLVNRRKFKFPTSEELERERTELPALEWLFLPRHGKDIADNLLRFKGEDISEIGSGYFIQYAGYVCYESPAPKVHVDSPYFLIDHPNDARKIVMICRLQFFHRSCQGYVETYWNPWPRSFNLKNLSPHNADQEARILLAAKSLVFTVERKYRGGRPAWLPKDLEVIRDDYIMLCACHQYLYSDDSRPSQHSMADFYEVNRSSLYRHLRNTFGISFSNVRSECENRLRPIAVDSLPPRFKHYLDRKRTEQVTDTVIKK